MTQLFFAKCMIQELIRQWWPSQEIKEVVSQSVEMEAAFLQLVGEALWPRALNYKIKYV